MLLIKISIPDTWNAQVIFNELIVDMILKLNNILVN